MIKLLKQLINSIRLLFIIKKEENTVHQSNTDTLIVVEDLNKSEGVKKQQEARWFTTANNLIADFVGEAPIVYPSHFDAPIRKQDQYEYIGEDRYIDNEELYPDDVSLLVGAVKPPEFTPNTVNYLSQQEEFDERFNRMQKKQQEDWDKLAKLEAEREEERKYFEELEKEN